MTLISNQLITADIWFTITLLTIMIKLQNEYRQGQVLY